MDCEDEDLVPEDAFWHVEASRTSGFEVDMVIEIEHEKSKYWLAKITNVCSNLLSIRWEGASTDIWFDVTHNKCFPLGYWKADSNLQLEPPASQKISDSDVKRVLKEYDKASIDLNPKPIGLFKNGGLDPVRILKPGMIVEVAFPDNSDRHWLAEIKHNVGGRLQLEWLHDKDEVQCIYGSLSFWLYFCHPRVHYLGYAQDQGDIIYCTPFESGQYNGWAGDLQKYLELRKGSDHEKEEYDLARHLIITAKSKRPDLIDPSSLKLCKKKDMALTFPSNSLKLVPVSILVKEKDHILVQSQEKTPQISCIPLDDKVALLHMNWAEDNDISFYNFADAAKDFHAYLKQNKSRAAPLKLLENDRVFKFKVNHKLEIVHPKDPEKICEAIVTRVTPPLVWVEISNDLVHVLPFNSTDLYPTGFCEDNSYTLTKLLSPTKKYKASEEAKGKESNPPDATSVNSSDESNDIKSNSKVLNDYLTDGTDGICPRIYFNHKCFTGPLLSKSKIRELPRFVGPGPVLLVLQEVISKIISVAYVPPRVLNELSSQSFESNLAKFSIEKIEDKVFKAKYQKKSYHDSIFVATTVEDIEEYCKAVCGHLKCCYNLFGPKLYDGDDCPSHCRGLRKTNKVLKRAIYYRQKAAKTKPSQQTSSSTNTAASNNVEKKRNGPAEKNKKARNDDNFEKEDATEDKVEENESYGHDDEASRNSQEYANPKEKTAKNMPNKNDLPDDVSDKVKNDNDDLIEESAESKSADKKLWNSKEKSLKNSQKGKRKLISIDESNIIPTKRQPQIPEAFTKKPCTPIQNKPNSIAVDVFKNPLTWTDKDVFKYMRKRGIVPSLAQVLMEHEVDGPALLLLDYNALQDSISSGYTVQYSLDNVKLLCRLIKDLKRIFLERWANV